MNTRNLKVTLVTTFAIASLPGCATMPGSVLLGAGGGAAGGATIGAIATGGRSTSATLVGGATGALAGALVGYLIHKGKESDAAPTVKDRATDKDAKLPFITRPEIRSIWVPDKIEGNQYIEGHRIYIIEKQSSWSKE